MTAIPLPPTPSASALKIIASGERTEVGIAAIIDSQARIDTRLDEFRSAVIQLSIGLHDIAKKLDKSEKLPPVSISDREANSAQLEKMYTMMRPFLRAKNAPVWVILMHEWMLWTQLYFV